MKAIAVLAFAAAVIFLCTGFYKMYVYENPDSESEFLIDDEDYANAYVGGDAYNYIINAGKATANFTLAIFFLILGFGTLALEMMYAYASQKGVNIKSSNQEVIHYE